jgi:hypothetical protein
VVCRNIDWQQELGGFGSAQSARFEINIQQNHDFALACFLTRGCQIREQVPFGKIGTCSQLFQIGRSESGVSESVITSPGTSILFPRSRAIRSHRFVSFFLLTSKLEG